MTVVDVSLAAHRTLTPAVGRNMRLLHDRERLRRSEAEPVALGIGVHANSPETETVKPRDDVVRTTSRAVRHHRGLELSNRLLAKMIVSDNLSVNLVCLPDSEFVGAVDKSDS